jgi:hypothetical protein
MIESVRAKSFEVFSSKIISNQMHTYKMELNVDN